MRGPVRRQTDDEDFAEWSRMTAVTFPVDEDRTRQEFANEADINVMMRKFGVNAFASRGVPKWGHEVDYDVDLQQALNGIEEARRIHERIQGKLEPELQDRFPTWESLYTGLVDGSFKAALDEVRKPPEPPPVVVP